MNKTSKIFIVFFIISTLFIFSFTLAIADSQGSIDGGGQLREYKENGSELFKISFGGWIQGETKGEWEVNFHNVGIENFDKTKFYTNDIRIVNYYLGDNPSCHSAFNFTAFGKWNNKPGYKLTFRGGDSGSPKKPDTARIELYSPNGVKVYDTWWNWEKEFTNESHCVGSARTGLDKGNLTVVRP